jgi:pyoverdine/dityrosine biosynthesis protein Dit1
VNVHARGAGAKKFGIDTDSHEAEFQMHSHVCTGLSKSVTETSRVVLLYTM